MIETQTIVIGLAALITLVALLLGCAQCFHRFLGFKDGIGYRQDIESCLGSTHSLSHPDGTLHPPAESITETDSVKGITFEPLPDIVGQQITPNQSSNSQASVNQEFINLREEGARYEIPRGHLFYVAEVGHGWFGQVLQGDAEKLRLGQIKTKVIVKMLKDDADENDKVRFLQEVKIYRVLDHPSMLRFLGQCTDTMPYLTVLEHAAQGDLKSYLLNNRENQESFIEKGNLLKFSCEMAAGLACMHRHDFIHRDFAARNCLVTFDLCVKIGDYGVTEETYKDDYMEVEGEMVPIRWQAPETVTMNNGVIQVTEATQRSNIWSFGVALWELFMLGEQPYTYLSNEEVIKQVIVEKFQQLPEPTIPVHWKGKVYDVMKFCWRDNRPGIEDVHKALRHLQTSVNQTVTTDFDAKWKFLVDKRSRSESGGSYHLNNPLDVIMTSDVIGQNEVLVTADVNMVDEMAIPKQLTDLRGDNPDKNSFTPSKLANVNSFQMTSTPVTKSDVSSSYATAQTNQSTMGTHDVYTSASNHGYDKESSEMGVEDMSLSHIDVDPVFTQDLILEDSSTETVAAPEPPKPVVSEDLDAVSSSEVSDVTNGVQKSVQLSNGSKAADEEESEIHASTDVISTEDVLSDTPVVISTEDVLSDTPVQGNCVDMEPQMPVDSVPSTKPDILEDIHDMVEENGSGSLIPAMERLHGTDLISDDIPENSPVKVSPKTNKESFSLDLFLSDKNTDYFPSRSPVDFVEDLSYRRRSYLSRDYSGMLPTIPEDRVPSVSDGSVVDLNFDSFDDSSVIQDNFEWDEDIGRQLVGMVHETTSSYNTQYGVELSDWSLDQSEVSHLPKRQSSSLDRYSSILASSVHISDDEYDEEDEVEDNSGIFTTPPQAAS